MRDSVCVRAPDTTDVSYPLESSATVDSQETDRVAFLRAFTGLPCVATGHRARHIHANTQ